jgi:nitrite reductase/ring-hydroxylating ferredoxin subunit
MVENNRYDSTDSSLAQGGTASAPRRTSAEVLLRQLRKAGYTVETLSVESTGDYALADADWNYKDVPHLNIVHTKVRAIVGTLDEDLITTVNLQKVGGIPFPLVVVNYATSVRSQTYYTTMGPYILVVYTEYEALGANRTKVTTTYNVAAAGVARLAIPLIRRIIRGNYRTLMSEDLPMRDRRGALRARGFSFRTDSRVRTFPETTDLLFKNVVPPARTRTKTESFALDALAENGSQLVGSDDDCGLRIVRQDGGLLFFPRLCDHEGASLDCAALRHGRLSCPWHAKAIHPLARVPISEGQDVRFNGFGVRIERSVVSVSMPEGSPS